MKNQKSHNTGLTLLHGSEELDFGSCCPLQLGWHFLSSSDLCSPSAWFPRLFDFTASAQIQSLPPVYGDIEARRGQGTSSRSQCVRRAELKLGLNSPNSYSGVLPRWVGGPFLGSEKRGTVPSLRSFGGGGGVKWPRGKGGTPDGGGDERRRGNTGSSVTPVGIRLRSAQQAD